MDARAPLTDAQVAQINTTDPTRQGFNVGGRLQAAQLDAPVHLRKVLQPADFGAGAGAKTVTWATPSGAMRAVVVKAWIDRVTDFAGGTLSAMTAAMGRTVGPDPDAFVEEADVFTGAGAGVSAVKGAALVEATHQPVLAAGEGLTCTLTPTGDTVANATAGKVVCNAIVRLLGVGG